MKFTKQLKHTFLGALLVILACSAVGCGKEKDPNQGKDTEITGQVTPSVSLEVTQEVTPTPTEEPRNPNPLNIEGYRFNEEEGTMDEAGNVRFLADIENEAKIDENFMYDLNILACDEEHILISYVVAKDYIAYMAGTDCKQHLVLFSTDKLEAVKELVLDGNFYIQRTQDIIEFEVYNEKESSWTIKTLDHQLNPIAEMETPGNTLGTFTPDGKRCYYSLDKKIYVLNGENNVSREVAVNGNCLVNYINGVLTDEQGNDYVIFWGMAADYKDYQFILNVATGEIERVSAMEESYSEIAGNTYMENFRGEYYPTHWLVGVSKDTAYDYEWSGTSADLSLYTLHNKNKLFSYASDDIMYFFLYDYESGDLLGSTSFDVEWMEDKENSEEIGETSGTQVFLCETPVSMSEDTLLLHFSNYGGKRFLVEWKIAVDEEDAQNMAVTKHEMGSLPSVDISELNNPLYTPGELRDSLKSLRTQADKLEEKYGVEIYIGEECSNIVGGYTVAPLTDYDLVEGALEMLEEEMGKYPDNFFEQFEYSWVEGLDIYLAGTLTGISEDVLDYAGGFKTIQNSRILLVMNCYDSYGVVSTFHHELCHAIEEKIVDASYSQENPLFNEATWNSFNPFEDMYTYTYAEYGYAKYTEFTYEQGLYDGDVEGSYFVDYYAMTYPTEDRARIFESVMSDHLFNIDFEEAPNLTEKINYFAQCIRDVFDTTGWEDVPWEAYLE